MGGGSLLRVLTRWGDYGKYANIILERYLSRAVRASGVSLEILLVATSGAGGTRLLPATPHRLKNPKWPPGGPKVADGV